MKKAAIAALVVLTCGILAAESAFAHGSRSRIVFGFGFGVPYAGYPYYYPPSYYYPPYYPYYPAPVVLQRPPVYIEQSNPAPAQAQPQPPQQQQEQGYWYYCAGAGAYYPYVKECPAGWQRILPQPG